MEQQCIYIYQRGHQQGQRCTKPFGPKGYCDDHRDRRPYLSYPRNSYGGMMCRNDHKYDCVRVRYYQCDWPPVKDGFCEFCIKDSFAESVLKEQCKFTMIAGRDSGMRCLHKAVQDDYCLHCFYTYIQPITFERIGDQPLITNYFKPIGPTHLIDGMQNLSL